MTKTKVCPRCGQELLDDMDVCYGCLYDFNKDRAHAFSVYESYIRELAREYEIDIDPADVREIAEGVLDDLSEMLEEVIHRRLVDYD